MTNQKNTKKLVTCSVMVALATVLSLIKVYKLPLGGSITLLSMLPICILSLKYGLKWGFASAFVYSLFQFALGLQDIMSWGLTTKMWIGTIIFDYLLAFTLLGIAGIFKNKGLPGIVAGISIALSLRFVSHFISGCIFFDIWSEWDNVYLYSIAYNGSFMLPELIFTVAGAIALFKVPQTRKILLSDD